jgi:hypothetical protein
MKSIGTIARYALLALWLISIGILASVGVRQATEFAVDGRFLQKENLPLKATDTLYVKFQFNEFYANDLDDNYNLIVTEDTNNAKVIYSNNVRMHVAKTDEKVPYIIIERKAKGRSLSAAKKTAKKNQIQLQIGRKSIDSCLRKHVVFFSVLIGKLDGLSWLT